MPDSVYGPLEEPPWQLVPPYEDEDPSLQRERWENGDTHRNRVRARKTRVLLDALEPVELSGYERRCLGWVACWEVHMVATLAALMRRAYAAGRESVMHPNCNHNCNQETETASR